MLYGKVVTTTMNQDGSENIREEGYHNGLNSIKEETRMNVTITRDSILTELIKCLDLLKTTTNDIEIRITKDKYGEPVLLQKTWTTHKEKLK